MLKQAGDGGEIVGAEQVTQVIGEGFSGAAEFAEFIEAGLEDGGAVQLGRDGHAVAQVVGKDNEVEVKRPMLGFSGTASLKRSDFGMTNLIPMIGDLVTVTFDIEFKRLP